MVRRIKFYPLKKEIHSSWMEGKRDNERDEVKLHGKLDGAVFRWKIPH